MKLYFRPILTVFCIIHLHSCNSNYSNLNQDDLCNYLDSLGITIDVSTRLIVVTNENNCSTCRSYLKDFLEDHHHFVNTIIFNSSHRKSSIYLQQIEFLARKFNIPIVEDKTNMYKNKISFSMPFPEIFTFNNGVLVNHYGLSSGNYEMIIQNILTDLSYEK